MEFQHRLGCTVLVILLTAGVIYSGNLEIKDIKAEETEVAWYSRSDTIYFWYSDPLLTDYINKAAVDFGEREDVHVLPMLVSADDYLETINTASVVNNQMPDAYIIDHASLEMAYMSGIATQISDVAEICNTDNFSKSAINSVTYNGYLVAYPFSYNTCALLYNADYLDGWAEQKALDLLTGKGDKYTEGEYFSEMEVSSEDADASEWTDENPNEVSFEIDPDLVPYNELHDEEKALVLAKMKDEVMATAVPKTLYDLLAVADTYEAPSGVTGVMSWDVSDILYNFWIVGDVVNLGGTAGDIKNCMLFNNDSTINCLDRYQYLHNFFSIDSDKVSYESVLNDFIDGKMIFTIASVDSIATLENAKKEERLGFEYKYTIVPDVSDEIMSKPLSITNAIAINGYSEKKEIANAFATYLVSDFASELYTRTGKPSCNINANKSNECLEAFDLEYARSVPLPKIIELENFWMELEAMFARVWNGEDTETQLKELEATVEMFFR